MKNDDGATMMTLVRRKVSKRQLHLSGPRPWALLLAIYSMAESDRLLLLVNGLGQDLLRRAAAVGERLPSIPSHDELFYPSAYEKNDGSGSRGFCNWIIPNKVMLGQYPGRNPEVTTPSTKDVKNHLSAMIQDAGVNMFCSLQSEIPSQEDDMAWEVAGGEIFLPERHLRNDFPNPFSHYAPVVLQSLNPDCKFIHSPIPDLFVPGSDSLEKLLLDLLEAIDEEDRCIYIHCWGGRGRAGLVGACLLSLIFPELDATAILDLVQAGYDSRLGAEAMPTALSKSPQTERQRIFVKDFVQKRQLISQRK